MRKAIVNSGLISSLMIPGHAPMQYVLRFFPSSDQESHIQDLSNAERIRCHIHMNNEPVIIHGSI